MVTSRIAARSGRRPTGPISRLTALVILVLVAGCRSDNPQEVYYPFRDQAWERFNILSFEMPVEASGEPFNAVFFARYNGKFPYESLDFHMIMRTPDGEERFREFQMTLKDKQAKPVGTCSGEVCEASIVLRKELVIHRSGLLVVELENLIPRLETPGLIGVGIRLEEE